MKNLLDKTDDTLRTKATNSTRNLLTPAMLKVVRANRQSLEDLSDEEFLIRLRLDRESNF